MQACLPTLEWICLAVQRVEQDLLELDLLANLIDLVVEQVCLAILE